MDCKQLQAYLDDYLDGILPAGEQGLADMHLAACDDCQNRLKQVQSLRHALRNLPVPAPSAGFSHRVLNKAHRHHQQRRRLLSGLATAMAASLVIWVSVMLVPPSEKSPGIEAIVMGVSETRKVQLVFNAPENFQKVTLQLTLSANIELEGFPDRSKIEWQTALKKGANTLVLPVKATGQGHAELVAHIKHQGKIRTLRIPLKVYNSGARLHLKQIPVAA